MREKIKSLTLKDLVNIVEQTIDHYGLTLPDSYQVRLDLLRELANDPNIHPARPNELDFRRFDVLTDYVQDQIIDQQIDRVVTTRDS
tara:strand:+ start:2674 stop:2934 length:261 start_codon:yes stop_codon:yes gene_type:complete